MKTTWLRFTFLGILAVFLGVSTVIVYALARENQALHAHLGIDPSMGDVFAREADRWEAIRSTLTAIDICVFLLLVAVGVAWIVVKNFQDDQEPVG